MSWEDFESEREARNYNSELYKKYIIRYYQTQGYSLVKNSLYEGTLSDIIMEKGKEKVWIEAKATSVSIFAKSDKLRSEIFDYFYHWLRLRPEKRFKFVIFAFKFSKKKETKKIVTADAEDVHILNWFKDQEDLNIEKKKLKKINSAKESEIFDFFKSIDVKVCSLLGLLDRVKEREKIIRKSLSSQQRKLLREIKHRKDPIKEKDLILLNFMELVYPQIFWQVRSVFKLKKTIIEKVSSDISQRIPEFVVPRFEAPEPVVRSFEKNLNILRPHILGPIYDRETNRLDIQRKLELLYTSLRRYLWCKGLRRWKNNFFFAYEEPIDKSKEKIDSIKIKLPDRKPKTLTKPIYRLDGTLYYVEHKSIYIRLDEFDGKIGLFIWPEFIFSEDGINVITGYHSSNLHKKYLNPKWNRNPSWKLRLQFWSDFLSSNHFTREKDSWFEDFRIKPLSSYTIGWKSKTIGVNELRIDKLYD
ncbi:MAG: hypothetical protein ACFFAI_10015 [Promethearchaeota archaeon]